MMGKKRVVQEFCGDCGGAKFFVRRDFDRQKVVICCAECFTPEGEKREEKVVSSKGGVKK